MDNLRSLLDMKEETDYRMHWLELCGVEKRVDQRMEDESVLKVVWLGHTERKVNRKIVQGCEGNCIVGSPVRQP